MIVYADKYSFFNIVTLQLIVFYHHPHIKTRKETMSFLVLFVIKKVLLPTFLKFPLHLRVQGIHPFLLYISGFQRLHNPV